MFIIMMNLKCSDSLHVYIYHNVNLDTYRKMCESSYNEHKFEV